MKSHVIKNSIGHIALSTSAFQGIRRIFNILKKTISVFRFFLPVKRRFYSHKEEQSFRAAAEMNKRQIPGPPL
ncbi:MAG: hypothetical protein MI892_25480 [Desulfobacterales bacterium]|nr:hypothetical protein [Desulfobacterales bacterium]